jgi:hypothetical protein
MWRNALNNTKITESIKKRKESVGVVEEKKKQKKSVTFSLSLSTLRANK